MVKIKMFNVAPYEVPAIENWAAKHDNIEVDYESGSMTKENIATVKGYDGLSLSHNGPFNSDFYPILASYGIKQIAQRSAGFDMYDLEEAAKHNLIITTVPSYSPSSIAEFAVTGALYFVRQVPLIQQRMQQHNFVWDQPLISRPVKDLTVAVVGIGRIGSVTARLFHGFGCKIVGYDPVKNPELENIVDYKDTLVEAISEADIVSLHVPGNKETYHLFNESVFEQLKDGVILVNAARGTVVETEALLHALNSNKVSGAVIDTYENEAHYYRRDFSEQTIEDENLLELIRRDDVLASPHIAFFTHEAVKNLAEGGLNSTMEVLNTGDAQHRVN
ncbi:D-2-hydroxyacid dehydrogenase [Staphylococcus simulans]|uniref:D-2-hydroxyacid dehydrogenase n=1 Tax=Staphylococcus simulans TaxID=1286 RepID=UPI003F816A20